MKRITSIKIENFRAFYGRYEAIDLAGGSNLLLYGENGSGKSSFARSLDTYFKSSRFTPTVFDKNSFAVPPAVGKIEIEFADVDPISMFLIPDSKNLYEYGESSQTNNVKFIQDSDLVKGFLSYRNLLKVYLSDEENPNLYELIVSEILINFIPVGETESIGARWARLSKELKGDARRIQYANAVRELIPFEDSLIVILKRLILNLNWLLMKYFKKTVRVDFELSTLINRTNNQPASNEPELRFRVSVNGILKNNHTDYLNEARLSALAICLFFGALKLNPIDFEYKILFLDDVFLGLDASNRYPILNILKDEFNEYQIFISTYDRNWFELSQRYFDSIMPGRWKYFEMYVCDETANKIKFEKPLIISKDNDFSKAVRYLHHNSNPDYPAAANYFRKYAEQILNDNIPSCELRNVLDDSSIEPYRLGKIIEKSMNFLNRIGEKLMILDELKNHLPTLLHPLSHYNLSAPIYKEELNQIQRCIIDLESHLKSLKQSYQILIPSGRKLVLKFEISATDVGYYDILTNEATYLLRNSKGELSLSKCSCKAKSTYVISNQIEISRQNFTNNKNVLYSSLSDAYTNIYDVIIKNPSYQHIVRSNNYAKEFTYYDSGNSIELDLLMSTTNWS